MFNSFSINFGSLNFPNKILEMWSKTVKLFINSQLYETSLYNAQLFIARLLMQEKGLISMPAFYSSQPSKCLAYNQLSLKHIFQVFGYEISKTFSVLLRGNYHDSIVAKV